jgi:hypothetical protein
VNFFFAICLPFILPSVYFTWDFLFFLFRHNLNTHNLEMMLVIRKWAWSRSRIATDALPPPDLSHATLLTDTAQQVNQM